jgi:hypothetical protein
MSPSSAIMKSFPLAVLLPGSLMLLETVIPKPVGTSCLRTVLKVNLSEAQWDLFNERAFTCPNKYSGNYRVQIWCSYLEVPLPW